MSAVIKPEPYPCDKREACERPCSRATNGIGYEVLTRTPEGWQNLSGAVLPNRCKADDARIAGAELGVELMTYEALNHPNRRKV